MHHSSKVKFAVVAVLSLLGSGAAFAHSGCDGDFALVNGHWIATRPCQRAAVDAAAREDGTPITRSRSEGGETREEYCRGVGHLRIETSTYCAAYSPD